MKRFIPVKLVALAIATPAFAHPGHIAESEGHSHWLAYAAAILAVLIGLGLVRHFVRRRRGPGY